ncbi:hypothetical protein T4D_7693 [Trichinella pseudospiralis]|uniref:Retrovirus-related Pol polyprotein from transposon TNT 1-94 n=1 Tax=Trichinella pseudospiralis TaxID=6337 RepID=A0A0V1FC46_TRIPS|nr:hypothetical protein T4D_7693 [Trichinella pseudospiralis]
MTAYIDNITEAIGKPRDNETVGGIILGGLLIEFQPLILCIQGSNQKIMFNNWLCKDESCAFVSHSAKKKLKERYINANFAAGCLLIQKATNGDRLIHRFRRHKHLTHCDDWMEAYNGCTTYTMPIANGTRCDVVKIPLTTEKTMVSHNVRPAPELALNLLSVSQIATQKKTLMFDEYGCQIVHIAVEVLTVTQYNGLYQLNQQDHWAMGVQDHRRLGHLSRGSVNLLQDGQATGISSDAITKTDCVTCLKGKQCRRATKRSEKVPELTYEAPCKQRPLLLLDTSFHLSIIFSRKSCVYFLKHKNEALLMFKDFIANRGKANFKKSKVPAKR